MGGGCTHITADPFVLAICEGIGWTGGVGVEDSCARDVLAHPNKERKAATVEIGMRVCLFMAQTEAYHCFSLLQQRS
jgi:hypothetical protein